MKGDAFQSVAENFFETMMDEAELREYKKEKEKKLKLFYRCQFWCSSSPPRFFLGGNLKL